MPRLSFRQLIITTLLGFSLCLPSTVSSVNAQEASLSGAAKVRQDIEQQRLKKQETEKQYTHLIIQEERIKMFLMSSQRHLGNSQMF